MCVFPAGLGDGTLANPAPCAACARSVDRASPAERSAVGVRMRVATNWRNPLVNNDAGTRPLLPDLAAPLRLVARRARAEQNAAAAVGPGPRPGRSRDDRTASASDPPASRRFLCREWQLASTSEAGRGGGQGPGALPGAAQGRAPRATRPTAPRPTAPPLHLSLSDTAFAANGSEVRLEGDA